MSLLSSTTATMQSLQATLTAMTALAVTDYHFPAGVTLSDGDTFDFVIVGSGAGGSTMASRLTEDGTTTVALIEAGGNPPLESTYAGLFPLLVNSAYEWNITSADDSYANQYLQNNVVGVTVGKMLGGGSGLDHVIKVMPTEYDFDRIAAAADDDSFKLENMLKYYIMSETVRDDDILAKYSAFHGTEGPLIATTEHSDKNTNILAAANELGHETIVDFNPNSTLGYNEPLLLIGDVWRQSASETYLGRAANRSNLYVQLNALATKIIIDSSNVATGVQIMTSDGTYKTINARKEVIVSCGAIKSPQLLMMSGIGNKTNLEEFGIEVKAELPVGDGLRDHVSAIIGMSLEESNETAVSNPTQFPVPMTTGYVSLDGTKDPTYQTINLLFPHDSSGLSQLCLWVFRYENSVCEALYNANVGKDLLFTVLNLMHPTSTGTVRINSDDPTVNPTVRLGHLSDSTDLELLAESLYDFSSLVNTTYFQSIDSEIIEMDIEECADYDRFTLDYWRCYARYMSATMWHYSSTCSVGSVVNSDMTVKGIDNLRVVDASVIPYPVTGNIITTVYAIAEKVAESIIATL